MISNALITLAFALEIAMPKQIDSTLTTSGIKLVETHPTTVDTPTCSEDLLISSCLEGEAEGFTTLKRFTFALTPGKEQEVTYIVARDTEYLFTLCMGAEATVASTPELTVLEGNHLIFNNALKGSSTKRNAKDLKGSESQTHAAMVGYSSQSTAVLRLRVKGNKEGCAVLSLGFK
jgi:hypothetical protein